MGVQNMAGIATDNLTPKQDAAIVALIASATVTKAAEACGVSERAIYNWLDDPSFMSAYRKARRRAFQQALGLVHKYAPIAVNALAKIMVDATAPHASRVTAATSLLKFSRESLDLDDLSQRIEALEQAALPPGMKRVTNLNNPDDDAPSGDSDGN